MPQAVRSVANLDLSAVTPTIDSDNNRITWADVPATITAEGAAVFAQYASADDLTQTLSTWSLSYPVTTAAVLAAHRSLRSRSRATWPGTVASPASVSAMARRGD